MPKRFSTARGREFGDGMRAVIERTTMTSREVADLAGWQEAKVSDMVNGKGGVSRLDVAVMLGLCRSPADERDHLLALLPDTHVKGWLQEHGKCAPVRPRTTLCHLAAGETLTSWHTHAIPVLLRTTDYMRALLISSATVPSDEIEERLVALEEMQELLRNGLNCTFYVYERALDLQVGEPEAHVGQLQHLLLMANRKRIKILVVPSASRAHAGVAGPFTHLSFGKYQSLVLLEPENSSIFIEDEQAVEGYKAIVEALGEASLNEDESRALIASRSAYFQEDPGEPLSTLVSEGNTPLSTKHESEQSDDRG